MTSTIRAIAKDDFEQWKPLFQGYCAFYDYPCEQEKIDSVWQWLMNSNHVLKGIVAGNEDGDLQGIAHYQAWPITLTGSDICYLSDLFVDPANRGSGVGHTLYQWLLEECKQQGWPLLSLLTQEGNETARGLYDKYGEASDFKFYLSAIES